MAHETAKQSLEAAKSAQQRAEAVRTAMSLGMTLNEIEIYLDWLDSVHLGRAPDDADDLPPPNSGEAPPSSPGA